MSISLVLLSGGLDSAVALAAASPDVNSCCGLFFAYGQAAENEEECAARAIADYYAVPLKKIKLMGPSFESGEIRGRNAFLVHGALLVAPPGPSTIILGIHSGTAYVDCTPDFVDLMQRSLALHTRGEVTLAAPFLTNSKADIYRLARELRVPIELTYSCECGGDPCGTCMSCKDRGMLSAIA